MYKRTSFVFGATRQRQLSNGNTSLRQRMALSLNGARKGLIEASLAAVGLTRLGTGVFLTYANNMC